MPPSVRDKVVAGQGVSHDVDTYRAVREVAEMCSSDVADLNFLFVSPRHDRDAIARAWREIGAGPTICCTTAGEIEQSCGHVKGAVVGAGLRGVRAQVWPIEDLKNFDLGAAMALRERMEAFLASVQPEEQVTAVVVLDGLSRREERVVADLHYVLKGIPIVGGSAGDDLRFERTHVMIDGECRHNVGAIALMATTAPTTTFMAHHFEPTGERLVVTAADPLARRVMEFDGKPAAQAYRAAAKIPEGKLTKAAMAVAPLMLSIGERTFIRSLVDEADGALDLYCAIEEGLVLQIGRPIDLQQRLENILAEVRAAVGEPQLVLGFDCILRRLEMEHVQLLDGVQELIAEQPLVGFSTYGEVFGGLHLNQTLTGLAIGR